MTAENWINNMTSSAVNNATGARIHLFELKCIDNNVTTHRDNTA